MVDGAVDYAQHLPVRVIAHMLGLPEDDGDLIDYLINAEINGMPLADEHVRGSIALLLIAGIDTTWSAIGAALLHLAQHPEHRHRLIHEPEVRGFAIEEFLRFYAPVTMARVAVTDHDLSGCPVQKGDRLLLPFPAANRDPEAFERAGEVILDRDRNRHLPFGLGIHRCLGYTGITRSRADIKGGRSATALNRYHRSHGRVHLPRTPSGVRGVLRDHIRAGRRRSESHPGPNR